MNFRLIFGVMLLLSSLACSAQDTIPSLDLRLLERLNHAARPADKNWLAVSNSVNLVLLATPVAMEIAGIARNDNNLKNDGLDAGISLALTGVLTYSLKLIVKRKRPYIAYPKLITGKSKETTYSFPSGHTSIAFAMATALSLSFPKWYVISSSFGYALLVAYSRSYLGVHYPGDILAGAFIGAGSSLLTWKLQRAIHFGFKVPIQ